MKEVEIYCGYTIEKAWQKVKEEAERTVETCFCKFNGKEILSTDTLDEAFQKTTGKTKAEFDKALQEWREEYARNLKEHEARIPKLTEQYRKEARGLVLDEALDYWDEIVPIRLGDIYRGMELRNVLDCCAAMRDESLDRDSRLRKAYDLFQKDGHSGMSASITMAMLRRFCPDGNELADACNEFRYGSGGCSLNKRRKKKEGRK